MVPPPRRAVRRLPGLPDLSCTRHNPLSRSACAALEACAPLQGVCQRSTAGRACESRSRRTGFPRVKPAHPPELTSPTAHEEKGVRCSRVLPDPPPYDLSVSHALAVFLPPTPARVYLTPVTLLGFCLQGLSLTGSRTSLEAIALLPLRPRRAVRPSGTAGFRVLLLPQVRTDEQVV